MFEQKLQLTNKLLLNLAYKYFALKLGITDEQLEKVEAHIVKRLGDAGGTCSGLYSPTNDLIKVVIKLQHISTNIGLVEVLAHEMVHAKQHLNGEFTTIERTVPFLWFFEITQRVKVHKGQILDDTPYYERLCEQEAFSRSRELTTDFLNFFARLESYPEPETLVKVSES